MQIYLLPSFYHQFLMIFLLTDLWSFKKSKQDFNKLKHTLVRKQFPVNNLLNLHLSDNSSAGSE